MVRFSQAAAVSTVALLMVVAPLECAYGGSASYGYDALGRLTTVTGSSSTTTYVYDAAGNRTSVQVGAAQLPVANPVSASVAGASSNNAIQPNLTGGVSTSLAIAAVPAHGSASVNGLQLSYTPSPTYSGADAFTYIAVNSAGSSPPATVSITIAPIPPTVTANPVATGLQGITSFNPIVLGGDTDSAGYTLTISSLGSPSHGSASFSGAVVTYYPGAGYSGTDSFTYTITDGHGGLATSTITLNVHGGCGAASC